MTDEGLAIKTALMTQSAITALVGTSSTARLWPHRVMPIAGYKPNNGVAIAFRVRGGDALYQQGLMAPSFQFKVWGIDEYTARQAAGVLVDTLNGKSFGAIRIANLDGLPQVSQEQDPNAAWVFGLAFFTIWLVM